ncbi:hypothetical protein GDO86_003555 [Hymenochirus boettgeri]|uniref:Peptidase M20 dimerisation domain-containing protein n=1 Tax=Hymenochirus boettgeri TaxID=247094 RepID=A0A8T2K208_9PIPI|nr:hypothetical protein GDO86_003555 [Hymenochirus boettgeri]
MAALCGRAVVCSLAGLLVLFVSVLLIRTYTWPERAVRQWHWKEPSGMELMEEEKEQLIEALKGAIRIPTVSFSEDKQNTTALAEFGKYIEKVFPNVFSSKLITHEVFGNYSHLFKVNGSDHTLQPYMLLAHLDVVPATPESWEVSPFSGVEQDGYIYGRGTLDDKSSLIGILQALEFLLKKGYKPCRSFYIGLGHDEEVFGHRGAKIMAEELKNRKVKLAFLVDEGLPVIDGIIPGLNCPVALIGITEKGSLTLKLTVNGSPGHSSFPPLESSIGILSAAVSRLEQNPMPNKFGEGPERAMFEHVASKFVFPLNIVMANLWAFSLVVSRFLAQSSSTNAMIRTTTALTIFQSGIKSNVVPPTATATVNFRIHPAQTVKEVLDIVRKTIQDERVELSVMNSFDPLPVSSHDVESVGYQILQHTIHSVFSGAPSAPAVCIGNTDSRYFVPLTNNIYRFNPVILKKEDLNRIHGLNERISKEALERLVQFYFQLIQNADIDKIPIPHRATHEL